MATFIPADNNQPTREIQPANKRAGFSLKELYSLLDCELIEVPVVIADGRVMVCDEEAKLNGKKRNERATRLAGFVSRADMQKYKQMLANEWGAVIIDPGYIGPDAQPGEADYIAGDVLICDDKEFQ